MFIDRAKIYVSAGKGGKGCQSFYRDKYMRPSKKMHFWRGRPDGADGGKGGDVVIKASSHLWSLLDFKYNRHFRAQGGKHGGSQNKKASIGQDCIIMVPVGTIIRDAGKNYLLADLDTDSKTLVVAKGGQGGKGNIHTDLATEGEAGEERTLALELKLISDIGIIGFPNVGKSSLIRCISNAESKVANFPFTTKSPILGVVDLGETRFIVADMPGLIKDAHQGKGLGLEFLRHIKRTKALLHVIDISGQEGRDPYSDYRNLNKELELYDEELLEKPQLIVANKMDLESAKDNLKEFSVKVNKKVVPISCLKKEGIEKLIKEMQRLLKV